MKQLFRRVLPLLLAASLMLTMTAFAADVVVQGTKGTITIPGGQAGYVTVAFDETNPEMFRVTYTGPILVEGNPYLVLMVAGEAGAAITEESIKYIDQTTAVADGAGKVSVSFTIYPSEFMTSTILITGMDSNGDPTSVVAAIVDASFLLGDVDLSGTVDSGDSILLLRYLASLETLNEAQMQAANTDGVGSVDSGDAIKLLRVLAQIESFN